MFIYIDESGVHKQNGKSTVAFIHVNVENVNKLEGSILDAERALRISGFHWSKQNWKIRHEFIDRVSNEKFSVRSIVFDNPFTQEKWEYALKLMLRGSSPRALIIDGRKPRRYVLIFKKSLRMAGVSVKKIRMGNDKSFPILRLADFFAGLVRARFESLDNKQVEILYNKVVNKLTTHFLGGQMPTSF